VTDQDEFGIVSKFQVLDASLTLLLPVADMALVSR
jgi:hypothetical protein